MSSFLFSFLLAFVVINSVVGLAFSHIRPRTLAPSFVANAVLDDQFIKVNTKDYLNNKWVVLLFYPFDYTFVCPTEIISFSEKDADFKSINTQVLAISTDSHHTHLSWTRTSRNDGGVGRLNIPLVADVSKQISSNFGVNPCSDANPFQT